MSNILFKLYNSWKKRCFLRELIWPCQMSFLLSVWKLISILCVMKIS